MRARLDRSVAAAALLFFIAAGPLAAQGHGRGLGHKKDHSAPPDPTIPGTGIRQFGIWLDDATLSPSGQGWVTFGMGYSEAPFGHQWDVPSMDAGMGIAPRVQLAISAPVSKVSYADGTSAHGLGDVYLAVKLGLLDPAAEGRSFGLAIAPVVELLSSGSLPEGRGRVQWALPVAMEKRFEGFRVYGSVGYFSRGAMFGSAAVEVPVTAKLTATGTLSHSRSLEDDPLSDELELAPSRWDVSGGAAYFFSPRATFFASIGRTVSSLDANGTSLSVAAGVSLGFQHRLSGRR